VIEQESTVEAAISALFRWFTHLPEGAQTLLMIGLPWGLGAIAYSVGRVSNATVWALILAITSYSVAVYLGMMWAAGVVRSGDSSRLLGLQHHKKDLRNLHWTQFEQLTSAMFETEGFEVVRRGGWRRDGGVDARIKRDGRTWLVQCKHWPNETFFVKVEQVRELLGVVTKENAAGGVLVTSGIFGEPATEFAGGTSIELIDGEQLWARLERAQASAQKNGAIDAERCAFCNSFMALRETGTVWVCLDSSCGATKPRRKEGWLAAPSA
jgi:HJR/Mrr/RecB family endonuclease